MKYSIGDVVQLKSGGPKMTVSGEGIEGTIHCTWFNESGEVQTGEFEEDTLTP